MLDFKVHNVGVYRYAQQTTWCNPLPCLSLHIGGLLWRQRSDSEHIERHLPPHLAIVGAGVESTYEYGPDRENWVIQIATKDIRNIPEDVQRCEIRCDKQWIRIPSRVYLNNTQRSMWQQHCQKLLEHSRDRSPRGELLVKSGICAMLSPFLEAQQNVSQPSPEEQFKLLIDEDDRFTKNLSELSEQCGYTADHMRILFNNAFGISPVQYRNQRRLSYASELIANSRLNIAEITRQLGFQHSSHFCTAYKKHFGNSPGKDIKRLRI